MRFLVHGSIAYDLLLGHEGSFLSGIDAKNLEKLSVNYLAQTFVRHHGGTAANIGWNLALLGHQPILVGCVGHDGDSYLDLLKKKGVDVSLVERHPTLFTATAVISTDIDERQISFFHPGADGEGSIPDVSKTGDIAHAIISPRNPMLMIEGAADAAKRRIPYLFDPGQVVHAFGSDELQRAVQHSAGLIVNDYEWTLASKKLGWNERQIVESCGMLVITRGEAGLTFFTQGGETNIPVCRTKKLVNPTGAGDAARAGLLHGLGSGWKLQDAGRLAAVLGCLVVEQEGTLMDRLDIKEVQKRAQESYGDKLPL